MKKVPANPDGSTPPEDGWSLVDFLDKEENPGPGHLMGTEKWATVYLASTPEQAALMGLSLPGVDTVKFSHNLPLLCVMFSSLDVISYLIHLHSCVALSIGFSVTCYLE